MSDLDYIVHERGQRFLKEVKRMKWKYEEIWRYYRTNMPVCIRDCKTSKRNHLANNEDSIYGPQGIYWIGNKAKILFVGKENGGWEDAVTYSSLSIEQEPLWFFYHKTEFMPGMWHRIFNYIMKPVLAKTIMKGVSVDELEWQDVIPYLAVTNLCKCFNEEVQYSLYETCLEKGFLFREIKTADTPFVVMFTRSSYPISEQLFSPARWRTMANGAILKCSYGGKVYYQMQHPSRAGAPLFKLLTRDIVEEWRTRGV